MRSSSYSPNIEFGSIFITTIGHVLDITGQQYVFGYVIISKTTKKLTSIVY